MRASSEAAGGGQDPLQRCSQEDALAHGATASKHCRLVVVDDDYATTRPSRTANPLRAARAARASARHSTRASRRDSTRGSRWSRASNIDPEALLGDDEGARTRDLRSKVSFPDPVDDEQHRASRVLLDCERVLGDIQRVLDEPKELPSEGHSALQAGAAPEATEASEPAPSAHQPAWAARLWIVVAAAGLGAYPVALNVLFAVPGSPQLSTFCAVRQVVVAITCIPALVLGAAALGELSDDLAFAGQFWRAVWELAGLWVLQMGLGTVALMLVPADRAVFLRHGCILFTPIIASLSGRGVSNATWIGCACTSVGVSALTLGGNGPIHTIAVGATADARMVAFYSQAEPHDLLEETLGGILAIAQGVAISLYTLRSGAFAESGLPPSLLQAWKCIAMAPMYLVWAAVDNVDGGADPWRISASFESWTVIMFTVVVAGYFTDAKLNAAQRTISPPETQLILATALPFSLLFAAMISGETIAPVEYAAGACIIAGALVSSFTVGNAPVAAPQRVTADQAADGVAAASGTGGSRAWTWDTDGSAWTAAGGTLDRDTTTITRL